MRSLIKLLVVLLICLVGIGIYRGWFTMSTPPPNADGDKVNFSVDKGKVKADIKKAEEKIKQLGDDVKPKEEKK